MTKIAYLSTGGTISMTVHPQSGLAEPQLGGRELLAKVESISPLPTSITVDVHDQGMLGGAQLSIKTLHQLAEKIIHLASSGQYDGFVITQGTDVMEETALLFDLLLNIEQPLVITGAMRNASQAGYDGTANLASAILTAAHPSSVGKGVIVCFANELYAAAEIEKKHSFAVQPFHAPGRGPIGAVSSTRLVYFHQPLLRQHIRPKHLDSRVWIRKYGLDGQESKSPQHDDADGYVVEGTGSGNGQAWMEDWIAECTAAGIPVVITSRSTGGWVDPVYGYPGGIGKLVQAGAILGHGLNSHKARIKLILALGQTSNMKEVQTIMEWDDSTLI